MKKILLVTRPIAPPWDEASKNFAYYLAKTIGAKENELELHLMTRGRLPELPERVVQDEAYTSSQNDITFSQKWRSLFFQFIMRNQFDVAHYFFTPTKLNSFLIKNFLRSKRTKSIQTVATLREDLYSNEEIKKLMFGDLIITYSDYAKNKLNSLGFQNVKRISPGIDLERYKKNTDLNTDFPPRADQSQAENSNFTINFTGEYTRLGAIDLVIDSFIEIAREIPAARLDLAVRIKNEKDAAKKEAVIEKLKSHNLLEKVSFFDTGQFQMEDIFNRCDISLFPVSNMHGKFDIPLAVVEAMACEKPVILSDLPILSELKTSDNSVTIKRGDVSALTQAILDLHDHPEKRARISRAARKFVEERFDIRKVAEQYRVIYNEL